MDEGLWRKTAIIVGAARQGEEGDRPDHSRASRRPGEVQGHHEVGIGQGQCEYVRQAEEAQGLLRRLSPTRRQVRWWLVDPTRSGGARPGREIAHHQPEEGPLLVPVGWPALRYRVHRQTSRLGRVRDAIPDKIQPVGE